MEAVPAGIPAVEDGGELGDAVAEEAGEGSEYTVVVNAFPVGRQERKERSRPTTQLFTRQRGLPGGSFPLLVF